MNQRHDFDSGALWVLNLLAVDADVSHDAERVTKACLKDSGPEFRALLLREGTPRLQQVIKRLEASL